MGQRRIPYWTEPDPDITAYKQRNRITKACLQDTASSLPNTGKSDFGILDNQDMNDFTL